MSGPTTSDPVRRFLAELRRRKVVRVTAVYAVVAWALIQVADVVLPRLALPDWTITFVVVLALFGFPVAVVLAWAFEVTPEGSGVGPDGLNSTEADPTAASSPARVAVPGRPRGALALAGLAAFVLLGGVGAYAYVDRTGGAGTDGDEADRSLAVLPFTNMSGVPENEYFSDGITEDILTRLSQVPGLRVISRTSVTTYKGSDKPLRQIGDELGVAYILEGSVRRAGDRVRITGQLIDARSDEHLWAESYDRDLTDVFAVQGEIASEIASALRVRLSASERSRLGRSATGSVAAYDLYLRGREYFNAPFNSPAAWQGHFVSAGTLFRQALAEDSTFAPAWAGLARSYRNRGTLPLETRYDSAVAFSNRAIAHDPELADGYVELGLAYGLLGKDDQGIREIRRALELNPNNPDALEAAADYDYNRGQLDEALRGYKRAAALEPTSFVRIIYVGATYAALGDFDQADAWYRRAQGGQADPAQIECYLAYLDQARGRPEAAREHMARFESYTTDAVYALLCAADVYLMFGELGRARELFERAAAAVSETQSPLVELAYIEQRSGNSPAADQLLDRAEARTRRRMEERGTEGWDLFELARMAAVRGDADGTASHLRAAVEAGFSGPELIELHPTFDAVREDTRIRALVAEMQADLNRMRERVRREGW